MPWFSFPVVTKKGASSRFLEKETIRSAFAPACPSATPLLPAGLFLLWCCRALAVLLKQ
jgi:hypothetical protein